MEYQIKYKTYILKLSESQGIIRSPQHICDFIKKDQDFDPTAEQLILIGLNTKNEIHFKHLIAKGTYNFLAVVPADIFSHLLRLNLKNFIIAHNHPSGDLTPSEDDIIFTKKLKRGADILGLTILDHIITGLDRRYYSFKEKNLIF